MTMQLRPYQKEAVDAVLEEWANGVAKTLLVLPTGCGKTVVFAKVAEACVGSGGRVLVLAHRAELLEQAADKIEKVTGLGCAVEKAEQTAEGTWFNITVGSVQSFNPARLERISPNTYTHIIIDEAHHTLAATYMRILSHFSGSRVLGVTATADRGDQRELGSVYQTLAYEMSLPRAVREGWLCRIKAQTIPLRLEISHRGSGDFTSEECATALDPYLEQIAHELSERCRGRKTVCFLPLIATARKFCAILRQCGFDAMEVNGESDNRADTLQWFHDAKPGCVLCNAMLLTEGWDEPSADCICVLRPTKVRALYAQMVGRGTRLSPGKQDLLLMDFLWMTSRHELCRPVHLVCENPDIQERIAEILQEETQQGAKDLLESEAVAEGKAVEERESKLARELEEQKRKEARLVDPLQFERSTQTDSTPDPHDLFALQPPTEDQLKSLADAGISSLNIRSCGQANNLLATIASRRENGLTTPKQIRLLERIGFRNVGTWTSAQAAKMITRVKAFGWRCPPNLIASQYVPK